MRLRVVIAQMLPDQPNSDFAVDVRLAQAGDTRAFERLIAAHVNKVRRFARAFARNPSDADDLAQEALIKVYRSIGSYRQQSTFSTWLYSIVRNTYLDVQKSRAQRERSLEDSLASEKGEIESEGRTSPDDQISQAEERQRLWNAIATITPEFRTAIVLFDIEGLSYEEIAAVENVPIGTVKSRLKRARDQLRRVLVKSMPKSGNPHVMDLVSTEEETQ